MINDQELNRPQYNFRPAGASDFDSSEDSFEVYDGLGSNNRKPERQNLQLYGSLPNAAEREALELERMLAWKTSETIRLLCMSGNVDLLKAQIELAPKFDVNSKFQDSDTVALGLACLYGHLPMVLYLLKELKADPNGDCVQGRTTPLIFVPCSLADEDVQVAIAKELIEAGCLIDHFNSYGKSALIKAASFNKKKLVRFLIESGANPNLTNSTGQSALHLTAIEGNLEMVQLLLDYDSTDPELVDNNGWCAAELAMEKGHRITAMYIHDFIQCQKTGVWVSSALGKRSSGPPNDNELDENIQYMFSLCKCSKYFKVFQEKRVTFNELLTYNDQDLKNMGIFEVGKREKLLNAIKAIHNTNWADSSVRNLSTRSIITAADVNSELSNARANFSHIMSSLEYIQGRIKDDPSPLAMETERARVTKSVELCQELRESQMRVGEKFEKLKEALKNCETLDELKIVGDMDDFVAVKPVSWLTRGLQGLAVVGIIVAIKVKMAAL